MKIGIRAALCVLTAASAAAMAGFTLSGLDPGSAVTASMGETDSMYVLGTSEGLVAVYPGGGSRQPLEVTEISLSTLRQSDREALEAGLPVGSQEELAQLLEDLGS
ncbi:MAG: BofC C-terminal domain-containing protein [Oscillospiraceae bacterium]|nr:BofC C-terminal domain-containing protein [Oscillospiraceae bacterium]